MDVHITPGNNKIGFKVANISLPPRISCQAVASHACFRCCYASVFYRVRKVVREAWDENYALATSARHEYFHRIRHYLIRHRPERFRWHVAGEILDQGYFDGMAEIARHYHFIQFLVYTKRYELDFSGRPENLSVVLSAWPGVPLFSPGRLPIAFIDTPGEPRAENYVKCEGGCEACGYKCWELEKIGKNVLLKEKGRLS